MRLRHQRQLCFCAEFELAPIPFQKLPYYCSHVVLRTDNGQSLLSQGNADTSEKPVAGSKSANEHDMLEAICPSMSSGRRDDE